MSEGNEGQQCRLYGDLAWLWPVISPPSEYLAETEEIADILRGSARGEVRRVLDLGCGGGHVDCGLKRYFSIVGVDLSEAMLALARRLNPEVTYLCGDLRDPPTDELFDAVYLGDAVNSMLSETDLRRAFQAAYDQLVPGGVFFTVAEVTRESFSFPDTRVSHHTDEHVHVTFIHDMHDPDPTDTTYDLTLVFLIRRGRELVVEIASDRAGLFPLAMWQATATDVGFEVQMTTLGIVATSAVIGVKPTTVRP